jgi:hypothetical protein
MAHIKDLKLYKENNQYYLSALIVHEDKKGIYEVSMPKIRFPVQHECYIDITENKFERCVSLDFGLGRLYAEPTGDDKTYFTMTCLEEKVHKMTLPEIEKILGYKIEIIKEK